MEKTNTGSFALVLHSHLPYVISHGRWPHGMDWLNEATAETYLPLIDVCRRLLAEGISPRFTIGLTPILCEMLASGTFREEFQAYLAGRVQAARDDEAEFAQTGREHMQRLARMWRNRYEQLGEQFERGVRGDILGEFRRLQDEGHIELMTCAATHGYLPLLCEDISIQAQVKTAVKCHQRHFGRRPKGFWLPECAYRPAYRWVPPLPEGGEPRERKGVEEFLSENGIEFFIVDSHLLRGGEAVGVYIDRFETLRQLWKQFESEYRPAPEKEERSPYEAHLVGTKPDKMPVCVLARDPKSGLQVWSGDHGYPGDAAFLEFHKKHFPGGLRYWSVTGPKTDLADKEEYEPDRAQEQLAPQVLHFADLVEEILRADHERRGTEGILVAPFDTELFGHWWSEGPQWLYRVRKELENRDVRCVTASEYLAKHPPKVVVSLPEGSWGQGGFHYIWLNEWTRWTWKHVYRAERRMVELASRYASDIRPGIQRILKQLARELLLLQSSDWQFLISTWAARDYAELRVGVHDEYFNLLAVLLEKAASGEDLSAQDENFLQQCEQRDAIFPDIEPAWWARLEYP